MQQVFSKFSVLTVYMDMSTLLSGQNALSILNTAILEVESGIAELNTLNVLVSGLQTISGEYVALVAQNNSGANVSGYIAQINILSGEVVSLTNTNTGLVSEVAALTTFSGSAMSYLQSIQTAADQLNIVLPAPVSGTQNPFGLV